METHSSVLAWRIPRTGEPGGLLSMGSHRVGHDWSDLAAAASKRHLFALGQRSVQVVIWNWEILIGSRLFQFIVCSLLWRYSFSPAHFEICLAESHQQTVLLWKRRHLAEFLLEITLSASASPIHTPPQTCHSRERLLSWMELRSFANEWILPTSHLGHLRKRSSSFLRPLLGN